MNTTAAALSSRPPLVIRGAKLHEPVDSPEIGLDWIRFVGPASRAPRLANWLRRCSGVPEIVKGSRYNFAHWVQYPSGALLGTGHAGAVTVDEDTGEEITEPLCCVEWNGSTLAAMHPGERVRIVRRMVRLGMRCTRLDGAMDFRAPEGRTVGLVAAVFDAFAAGEVCGAKCRDEIRSDAPGGELRGRTVYLGKAGSLGSGRMLRVYDKGLETKTRPAGEWERYEVVFSGETAKKIAAMLARTLDWTKTVASFVLGSMDYREPRRGVSRSLSRRPRCEWWAAVVRSVEPDRVRVTRRLPTLESAARWMRTAVAPMLERLAQETGQTVAQVWAELVGPVAASMTPQATRRVWEFVQYRADARPWQLTT